MTMSNSSDNREFTRFMHRAYLRDGEVMHSGESLLLACMLHAKGGGRESNDMNDVLKIMKDKNVPN